MYLEWNELSTYSFVQLFKVVMSSLFRKEFMYWKYLKNKIMWMCTIWSRSNLLFLTFVSSCLFSSQKRVVTNDKTNYSSYMFLMNFSDEIIFYSLIWRKYQKNFSTNLILKTNDNHLYNVNYIQLLPTVVFSKLIHLQQQQH